MPNPPVNPPASAPANMFVIKGLTTIRWGTDGVLQDAPLQAAIVKSIRQSKRVSAVQIENNAGYTASEILVIDGQDYDITVEDDTSKTWPLTGGKISLQGPDDAAAVEFLVVDDNWNASRKQPGERVIKAKSYSAFIVG